MYETFTPFSDINSVNDILRQERIRMNYNRIGKFLSSVLVTTQHLFIEVQVEIECG